MKKKLLPIALLSAMLLVACGSSGSGSSSAQGSSSQQQSQEQSSEQSQEQSSEQSQEQSSEQSQEQSSEQSQEESSQEESQQESSQESSEEIEYAVVINNAQELVEKTIRVGDHEELDIELTPEANVMLEISRGNLVITSSDTEVMTISGVGLNAVGQGNAVIEVQYHDVSESIELTVEPKLTPKIKYGTVHEGTLEDPFDNADAVKVGHFIKDAGEKSTSETDLYIRGTVASFYHNPGSRTDGAVSWFLEKGENDTEQFEIYKCYKDDGTGKQVNITDDDIWKGAIATAHGPITYYNDQMETSYAWLDKVEGDKPEPPKTYDVSVAEAIAVGVALTDGDSTYDFYNVTGYVVKKSGTNYFLSDAETVAEDVDVKTLFELYGISDADEQAKLLEGAKVTAKVKIKNYHGQAENGNTPEITVLEEGHKWSVPEPAIAKKTLAEFIAIDPKENGKKAYEVTAKVKSLDGSNSDGSEFGNITLTDDTNDLIIYGCTATETALAWDGSESYAFKNPKDFLSNEVTAAIKVGDTLKMRLVRADYNGTIQGKGIVLEVNPDEGGGGQEEVDYGTLENPLSVATLLADDGTICEQVNGKFSAQKVIVKGVLKEATYSPSYGTYTGYLQDETDATKTIKFTGVKLANTVAAQVAQNDVVILEHYLEYYANGYSLYYQKDDQGVYDYGDFLALVTVGTSTITVEAEHATVTGLAETYTNYTTATFTVQVEENYDLVSVKVNGTDLNAVEGQYSFTVVGNTTVKVTTKEAGAQATEHTVTLTPAVLKAGGMNETAGVQAYSADGLSVAISNGLVSDTEARVYKNATISFEATVKITKVVFTCTANGTTKYGPGCFAELEGYTFEAAGPTGTWQGETAETLVFTASSNQVRASSIEVTYYA